MLRLCALAALLLGGCGGDANQDFGPTRKVGPPSTSNAAGSQSRSRDDDQPVPTKSDDTDAVKTNTSTEDVASKSEVASPPKEAPTDLPLPLNAAPATAKTETPESVNKTAAKADPKVAGPAVVLPDKVTRKPSREDDDDVPANPAVPDPADKSKRASPPATETPATADAPEVTRHELSPELREWLIAKRRQATVSDGRTVVTAVDLSRVSVHELRSGQLSNEFFGPGSRTTGLGLGPKRDWVIGATDAGWVRLWTIESQAGWDRFARAAIRAAQASRGGIETDQNGVWALATSPKNEWFIVGGDDGSLRRCNVVPATPEAVDAASDSRPPRLTLNLGDKVEAHAGAVTDLEISSDDQWFVSGGSDQRVRLWNTSTGELTRTWADMPAQITDVGVSANGKIVAAAGLDKFARWWSAEEPESVPVPEKDAKPKKPPQRPASPEANPANSAADPKKAAATDAKPKNGLEHPDIVLAVAVSADGQFVATGCKDKFVRVWNLSTGLASERYEGAKDAVLEVCFVDRDQRLVFRDRSGAVRSRSRVQQAQNDDDAPPPPTEQPFQFLTPITLLNPDVAAVSVVAADVASPELAQFQKALRNAIHAKHALRRVKNC